MKIIHTIGVLWLSLFPSLLSAEDYTILKEDIPCVIKDPDGFVNVRSDPKSGSKILNKMPDYKIFWIYMKQNAWGFTRTREGTPSSDWTDKNFCFGWLHESRVVPLSSFTPMKVIAQEANKMSFQADKMSLVLTMKPSDEKLRMKLPINVLETQRDKDDDSSSALSGEDKQIEYLNVYFKHLVIISGDKKQVIDISSIKETLFTSEKIKIWIGPDQVVYICSVTNVPCGDGLNLGPIGISIKNGMVKYVTMASD